MSNNRPHTLIEFKDYEGAEESPLHKTARVFVNGSQIDVEKDGIDIEFGDDQATVVTLRIQPTEIRFNK